MTAENELFFMYAWRETSVHHFEVNNRIIKFYSTIPLVEVFF